MLPNDPTEALSPAERRGSDRKKLIVDVQFNGGDTTGIANSRDIGVGGLYLATKTAIDSGTQLYLKMVLGGTETSIIGVVVYSDPGHGVGIRFNNLSEVNQNLLKKELELD